MIYKGAKKGKYISLRSVETSDAKFTGRLRSDAILSRYVHKVDSTERGQIEFIKWQREEEDDYYFLIEADDKRPLGTIALYHFDKDSAELGRWVSYGNAFENIESIVLLHDIAFEETNLNRVYTCTNVLNEVVVNFWKRFGGDMSEIINMDDFVAYKNIVTKETYYNTMRPKILKLLRY